MTGWIDVTAEVRTGMLVWPGDPPVSLEQILTIEEGDGLNLTEINAGVHIGTHIDAPRHYVDGGATIEAMPLELMTGDVRVVELDTREPIGAADVEALDWPEHGRVFFKTRNSRGLWPGDQFDPGYVSVAPDGARALVERGVRFVGIDYLSIGPFDAAEGAETHRILLEAGVWVVEGLDLRAVAPGDYELIATPIKLVGSDGAPARVLLRARG